MLAFSRFLRYFMAVGRLGSIRKAADELHVSASAIDRQILNVEADIGMPLFERLPTGLRLTAAGEIMMAAGGRWQKSMTDVRAQIEDLRGLKRGNVDIAIIDALAKGYIPATISAMQSRYPGITVGVRVLENNAIHRVIANGEVDFGIFFEPRSVRDLTVRAFTDVVLGFVTLPDHPLAQQRSARFSACAGSPVILPAKPLAVHEQIAVLEATSQITLAKKVVSDNIQMIASLVAEGIGIGMLTSLDVINEVKAGSLAFTPITDPILRPMTLALCTAASRPTSYAADIVLREIIADFSQLGVESPVAEVP
ncbi:LysR substrate-binding domain-containing protein [Novosphingobium sp.]|uniref:LysR family transcriptional regulator n=1 Tax=Novosphingobium sp. TaxID=1874826 RepID=UPI00334052C8